MLFVCSTIVDLTDLAGEAGEVDAALEYFAHLAHRAVGHALAEYLLDVGRNLRLDVFCK